MTQNIEFKNKSSNEWRVHNLYVHSIFSSQWFVRHQQFLTVLNLTLFHVTLIFPLSCTKRLINNGRFQVKQVQDLNTFWGEALSSAIRMGVTQGIGLHVKYEQCTLQVCRCMFNIFNTQTHLSLAHMEAFLWSCCEKKPEYRRKLNWGTTYYFIRRLWNWTRVLLMRGQSANHKVSRPA